jgi:hypothetical protein
MSSSPAQILANQHNAELSKGPKTSEGTAVSSKNARKHGLLSRDLVLPDEDAGEYREFVLELDCELHPQGAMEKALVERIVGLLWRLRRAGKLENAVLYWQQLPLHEKWPDSQDTLESFFRCLSVRGEAYTKGADTLAKLSRYESAMQRNLLRMMHELQRIQAVRKGEHVPVPQAIDVDVTVGAELRDTGDVRLE